MIKISTEVYKLKPFEIAMLVKFDFGGQNSCFDKAVLLIKKQGYLGNMTFKMTLNDLEGQRSFSQNDLYNMNVKCTKFDVSMLISFEVIEN